MEFLIEIILQFILEILGQALLELLAELGIRSVGHTLGIKKFESPLFAVIGYLVLAAILGFISINTHPAHFIKSPTWRIVNLIVTPITVGLLMGIRRKMLLAKEKIPIRLDSFSYGFFFSLTFALIRFIWIK